MTVIITSDQVSSRTLGNSYGLLGPLDFSLFLDFNAGSYQKRVGDTLASFQLSEVVSVLRGTEGEYLGRDGTWMSAGPNTPRIHYMEEMGVSGLLVEGPRSNLLANPRSPVTQTVTVPTTGLAQALALRVEGTGSATMSGGVSELSRVSATQGAPQGAMPVDSGNGTAQVTVTVSGSVTRFQLERCPSSQGGSYASTFVPDGLATRATEFATLTPSMAEALGGADGTIVAQWVEHERLVTNFAALQIGVVAAVDSDNPDGGLYLRRAISASGVRSQALVAAPPNSSSVAKNFNLPAPGVRRNTSVLAWGNRGQHVSNTINGDTRENSDALSLSNPNTVRLGGNDGFGSTTGEAGGILTKLVMYKRQLTREEVVRISASWV